MSGEVESRSCSRKQPRLLVRGQQHVENSICEYRVGRIKVTTRISPRSRTTVHASHPAAETADAGRVGVENLDVMPGWPEHAEELTSSQA